MTTDFAPEPDRPIDKRITGERNKRRLLHFLGRFGWLTLKMIAELIWHDMNQALAMARRLLRTLLDEGLVLRRPLQGSVHGYTLSAAGARWLTETTGEKASSGASLQLGNVTHRACSNWYVISQIHEGHKVWTEHEVQTGRCPVHIVNGKICDFAIETPFGIIWGECENAWKSKKERAKATQFCIDHLARDNQLSLLAPEYHLFRVVIVGTSESALDAMTRSFTELHQSAQLTDGQAGDVDLVLLPVDKSLNCGKIRPENLYWDRLT